jgi:LAO/AO transport system kinase
MKAGILEVVDLLVINKADQPGARKLMLDLGKETADSDRVLQTVASEHQGIETLQERIFALEQELRSEGTFNERRRKSREKETMDWLLELIKPQLAERVGRQSLENQDPRLAARQLADSILHPGVNADED